MTNDEIIQERVKFIEGYIVQYNDGLITSHEMANIIAHRAMEIADLPEQGCDGLPPNNILPNGERDDGIVFTA